MPERLVDTPQALDELLAALAGVDQYAIDTEFHRERSYFSRLALVQIAWEPGDRAVGPEAPALAEGSAVRPNVALVDPLTLDPRALLPLLKSPALAVLHASDQDLEVLEQSCGAVPSAIFDTQASAAFLGYSSPSLVSLTESMLGIRLQKGDQLTDWTRRPLSAPQRSYAASDVAHLLELKELLAARLARKGRDVWAAEECAILLRKDRSPTVPDLAWWKLPHSRQLRGASRGIAQEVAAWRERRAQRLDLPVRFVLSDLALMSLAQRAPASRSELHGTRGIDGRHLGGNAGVELMAAIEAGRALAPSALRLPPAAPIERANRPIVTLASAYVGQRAVDLELDPAVLATRADLVAFFQQPRSGRLTSGWRAELLGAALDHLANGAAAMAFDRRGRLVLEERSGRPAEAS